MPPPPPERVASHRTHWRFILLGLSMAVIVAAAAPVALLLWRRRRQEEARRRLVHEVLPDLGLTVRAPQADLDLDPIDP